MDIDAALKILDEVCEVVNGTRAQHKLIAEALETIRRAVTTPAA